MGDARPVLPNVIVAVSVPQKRWRAEGFQQFKSLIERRLNWQNRWPIVAAARVRSQTGHALVATAAERQTLDVTRPPRGRLQTKLVQFSAECQIVAATTISFMLSRLQRQCRVFFSWR